MADAKYRVKVGDAEYLVTAPDANTAWQWANMTHAQAAAQPTAAPAPAPTTQPAVPAQPTEEDGFLTRAARRFFPTLEKSAAEVIETAPRIFGTLAGGMLPGTPSAQLGTGLGYLLEGSDLYREATQPVVQELRQSAEQRLQEIGPRKYRGVFEEEGFLPKLGSLAETVAESAPPVIAGLGAGLLTRSPAVAGAIMAAGNAPVTYGGIRERQKAEGIDDVRRAVFGTAASAALDTLTGVGGKVLSGTAAIAAKEILEAGLKQAATRVAKGAGEEGVTESLQNVIEQVAGGTDPLTKKAMLETLEAGLAGAFGGTVFTGATEVVAAPFRPKAAEVGGGGAAPTSPEVRAEFQRLASQEVAAIMAANPDIDQRAAVAQVSERAEELLNQAATNVAARTEEEAGGVPTTDTGVDELGRAGAGAPTDLGPEPTAGGTPELGAVERGGVGRPVPSVSVPAVGKGAGVPPLDLGDFAPAVAAIQAAPNMKVRKSAAMQLVSDIAMATPQLQGLQPKKYTQAANQIAQAAASKKAFDPVSILYSVAGVEQVAPEVAPPTLAPELAPTTAIDEELAARDQEVSQELLAPEVQTEPTVAETATVEKVAPAAIYDARNGENALSQEELLDQLDFLQELADRGKLTPERLAASDFGKTQPTNTMMALNQAVMNDPVGTVRSLRERAEATAPEGVTPPSTITPTPVPTPQQIVENYPSFARTAAEDTGYGEYVPLFTEGARDALQPRPGVQPLTRQEIEAVEGPAAADAYEAGMQWGQERAAEAQAAPEQVFEDIGEARTPAELISEPRDDVIYAMAEELPEAERVNVRARLERIMTQYQKSGDIERLLGSLETLRQDVDRRIDRNRAKRLRDRVRGFERAMEVIYRAERTGQLTPEAAGLVRWLLEQNPAIADELAISLREGAGQTAAGQYVPASRIATIFTSRANDGTATHEVLHHTERLMPEKVRDGLRNAWRKRIEDLIALAEKTNNTNMREVLGTIVQAYYGDAQAQKALKESFEAGTIPYSVYHLSNPSEFWAVNATDLIGRRARRTGWLGAARNWIEGLIEKAKDLFGLPNDTAVITGLNAIMEVESGTIRGQMLSAATRDFMMYAGEAAHFANRSKLAEAQALEAAGALSGPTGTTRAKTGWFRGVDGKWRFEINDRGMMFNVGYTPAELKEGRTYLLGQVIEHPELFKQYPDLAKLNVQIMDTEGAGGFWDWTKNLIAISNKTARETTPYLNILAHEIQHAVQTWEGFANGASHRQYPISVDAVQKALNFLDSNKNKPLFLWNSTYDTPRLEEMRATLQFLRDDFGSALDKANDFFKTSGKRFMEVTRAKNQARDEWMASDHPEAVKYRELTAARVAAAEKMQDYSIPMTAEERQVLRDEYEIAKEAESAQYKYITGLVATGVVPKTEAEEAFEKDREAATRILEQANGVANMSGANKLMYYLTSGEVEARDTEQRRRETEERRAEVPPYVAEPFGEISSMITIDPFTGIASAPPSEPINTANVNAAVSVKLTKAQIRQLEEAAGIRKMKLSTMQKRIARSRSAGETMTLAGKLMTMARSPDKDVGLLSSLFNSVSPTVLQKLLGPLATEDVVRLGERAGLNATGAIDRLMRDGYIPYVNRLMQRATKVAEKWADFTSRSEKGAVAMGDVMFIANMYDVDPALAPTAGEYMKRDPKLQDLLAKLAAVKDPKKQSSLKAQVSKRRGEIQRVYFGAEDADGTKINGWKDVPPEGKQLFRMARDHYRNDFKEHYRLLMERIDESGFDEEDAARLKASVNKMFAEAAERTIYFPMKRFGEYWVSVGKGASGEFHMFESASAQDAFLARLRSEGETRLVSSGYGRDSLRNLVSNRDASTALKNILDMIDDGSVSDMDLLKDHVFQMYLTALPEADMRRRFIHRQFKTGFSTDGLRTFASTAIASANQLGRLAYNYQFKNAIERAYAETEGMPSKRRLDTITRELELRVNGMMSPDPENGVDWFLSLGAKGTFLFLLSSPKSAIMNLTQLHIVGLPTLSAEFGEKDTYATAMRYTGGFLTGKRIANPFKDEDGNVKLQMPRVTLEDSSYIQGLKDTDPAKYEAIQKAWQFANEHDVTQSTFAASADVYERSNKPTETYGFVQSMRRGDTITAAQRATANAAEAMGALFHNMERIGREVMFMSAFEMGYDRNIKKGMSPQAAGDAAMSQAAELTNKGMFDFSTWNKSRYAKSRLGRLPLQMRSYSLAMTSLLFRSFVGMLPLMNKEGKLASARMFFGVGALTALYGGFRASQFYVLGMLGYGLYQFLKDALGDEDEPEDEVAGGYLTPETIEKEMLKYADDKGRELSKKDMEYYIRSVWIPETFGSGGTLATALGIDDANADKLAKVADMGLPTLFNVDISNSVSLGDLWHPVDVKSDDPETRYYEMLGRMLLGPSGALFIGAPTKFVEEANAGNFDKAIEAIMPAAIRNYLKSERLQEEGLVVGKNRDVVLKDPSFYDTLTSTMQSLGFSEAETSRAMQLDIKAGEIEKGVSEERTKLLDQRYRAILDFNRNPTEETQREWSKVERAIDIYNLNYPSNAITEETKEQSFQNKSNEAAERAGGLGYNPKIPVRQPLAEERARQLSE